MLEAGAHEVYPSFRGAPVVRAAGRPGHAAGHLRASPGERDDRPPVLDGADGRGRRARRTDSFGLVRGTQNVQVNDASLLPDAPGVNPQASVMALAIRNARRFVETVKR